MYCIDGLSLRKSIPRLEIYSQLFLVNCQSGHTILTPSIHYNSEFLVGFGWGFLRLARECEREDDADDGLADEHLQSALQEQHSSSPFVDHGAGHYGCDRVHGAHDDSRVERCFLAEPDGVQEHRHVEHDGVDARELLEE